MTTEQIKEAIAKVFESYRLGKDGNTATEAAAAVMALVGPKPLVWKYVERIQAWVDEGQNGFTIYENAGDFWLCTPDAKREPHPTLVAAHAAAQSHADDAHWANTPLSDKIEGKE